MSEDSKKELSDKISKTLLLFNESLSEEDKEERRIKVVYGLKNMSKEDVESAKEKRYAKTKCPYCDRIISHNVMKLHIRGSHKDL